jgi:hypothetical protein
MQQQRHQDNNGKHEAQAIISMMEKLAMSLSDGVSINSIGKLTVDHKITVLG